MTLEDETGIANIVVWPKVMEQLPQGGDGRAADPGRGLYPEQPGKGDASGGQRLFDRSHDLVGLANDALAASMRCRPAPR
jgi:error-prone DNA polymerase